MSDSGFLGLKAPPLRWSAAGAPFDMDHGDGYFSDTDGVGESRAVFLQGCHFPHAWQGRTNFTIGELGFGTGLNFLNVWQLWRQSRPAGARLHFISIEAAPFALADLARAHQEFEDLHVLAQALRQQWPGAIKGVHRLCFDDDALTLTLYCMDVAEALAQIEAPADAWFLDGFAPSRNQAMWSDDVFADLARLSRTGTRAATFSVAGQVRRGLQAAGFSVQKMPGHGRKRQRLEAVYEGPPRPPLRRPTRPAARAVTQPASVLVLGGGIAGASVARAFLRRGVQVTILSKDGLAGAASGNAAALVSPRLDLEDSPPARFLRTAFAHATRIYAAMGPAIWSPCGVLRLPAHDKDEAKFARLARSGALPVTDLHLAERQTPAAITGQARETVALFIRPAGTVIPRAAIAAMTQKARLRTATIASLEREHGQWCARDAQGRSVARAPLVVLALGAGTLAQTAWLDFRYLRGQVSLIPARPAYHGPAVLGEGYALGLADGRLLTGADFVPVDGDDADRTASARAHRANFARLRRFAPALAGRLDDISQAQGRVAVRAATPDQMPYAGPMPDRDDFTARFVALKDGFVDPKVGPAHLLTGLFALMGLGARGFTLAPVLGEAIACEALGEPSPLERTTAEALHPARVLEKMLKSEHFN